MSEETLPAETTLLLKGGLALTPNTDWHDPPQADIAIAGDKIVGVCPGYRPDDHRNVETIEARDHLVLPGFVNAHYHSHDVLAKGTLEEVPLETWRLYALPPQYPPRSAEEVYARTLLGALECLRSGMTTVQDMLTLYPYDDRNMDAVMRAYAEVGIRVVFALQYADRKGIETIPFWKDTFPAELHPLLSTAAEPERHLDLIGHFEATRLKQPAPPRTSWALGPSSPERCSPAILQRTVELARRYDLPVYTHIYESRGMALQAPLTLPEYSGFLIRRPARDGALGRARRRRGAQSAGQPENEMRHCADPRAAGRTCAHRPRLRQLQLLGRAEHVRRHEAVHAARRRERPDPRPAAGGRGAARGDRRRRRGRAPRRYGWPHRGRAQGRPYPDRHARPDLLAAQQRRAPARPYRGRPRRAPRAGRRQGGGARPGTHHHRRDDDLRGREGGDARLPPRLRGDLRPRRPAAALPRPGPPPDHGRRARHRAPAVRQLVTVPWWAELSHETLCTAPALPLPLLRGRAPAVRQLVTVPGGAELSHEPFGPAPPPPPPLLGGRGWGWGALNLRTRQRVQRLA